MLWKQLAEEILSWPEHEQEQSATVYDRAFGEYYGCDTIEFEEGDDILDAGHKFIVIET